MSSAPLFVVPNAGSMAGDVESGRGGAPTPSYGVFAPVSLASDASPPHHNGAVTDTGTSGDATIPAVESPLLDEAEVVELIPLCAQHPSGPKQTTATFGYDIATMRHQPWAKPEAKLSDYFNYGFNETSWRLYCRLQAQGKESLHQHAMEVLEELRITAAMQQQHLGVEGGPSSNPMAAGGAYAGYPPPDGTAGYYGGPDASLPPPPPPAGGPRSRDYGAAGRGYEDGGQGGGPHRGGAYLGGEHSRYKTQLCQRFAEGRCTRGATCNYAHGDAELRAAPPPPSGGGVGHYGGGGPGGARDVGYRMKRPREGGYDGMGGGPGHY